MHISPLAQEFDQACEDAIQQCIALGYPPTIWIGMTNGPGGATAAAKRLLESPNTQSGFERLVKLGRTDLTIEFAVLHPEWDRLFGPQHREAAWWRLQQVLSQ